MTSYILGAIPWYWLAPGEQALGPVVLKTGPTVGLQLTQHLRHAPLTSCCLSASARQYCRGSTLLLTARIHIPRQGEVTGRTKRRNNNKNKSSSAQRRCEGLKPLASRDRRLDAGMGRESSHGALWRLSKFVPYATTKDSGPQIGHGAF